MRGTWALSAQYTRRLVNGNAEIADTLHYYSQLINHPYAERTVGKLVSEAERQP